MFKDGVVEVCVLDFPFFQVGELFAAGDFLGHIAEVFEAADVQGKAFDAVVDGLATGDDKGPVAGLKQK